MLTRVTVEVLASVWRRESFYVAVDLIATAISANTVRSTRSHRYVATGKERLTNSQILFRQFEFHSVSYAC